MKEINFACGSIGKIGFLEDLIQEALSSVKTESLFYYSNALGTPELREAVAELHNADVSEVMITSSSQQSADIVFSYLRGKHNNLLFQEPAFFGAVRHARKRDFNAEPFSNFRELSERIEPYSHCAIYTTSNFNSTVYGHLSENEKQEIADKVRDTETTIFEDNPYDLLYFEEKPTTIYQKAPKNTIYAGSFSKILAPGIRVGYIVADAEKIKKLKSHKIDCDLFTSPLLQSVCLYALKNRSYLHRLRAHFMEKRDTALDCLQRVFGNNSLVGWETPKGGIFLTMSFFGTEYANLGGHFDISTPLLVKTAKEKYNLTLVDDRHNYLDGKVRNTIRINFVQNPDNVLEEGIRRLYSAWKEAKVEPE